MNKKIIIGVSIFILFCGILAVVSHYSYKKGAIKGYRIGKAKGIMEVVDAFMKPIKEDDRE